MPSFVCGSVALQSNECFKDTDMNWTGIDVIDAYGHFLRRGEAGGSLHKPAAQDDSRRG